MGLVDAGTGSSSGIGSNLLQTGGDACATLSSSYSRFSVPRLTGHTPFRA